MTNRVRLTDSIVRSANTVSLLEGTTVQRHSHVDLAGSSTLRLEPLDGSVGRDTSALASVEVSLVVSVVEPRASVIVSLPTMRISIRGSLQKGGMHRLTIKFQ